MGNLSVSAHAATLTMINNSNANLTAYSISNRDNFRFVCLQPIYGNLNGINSPAMKMTKFIVNGEPLMVETFKINKHSAIQYEINPECDGPARAGVFGITDEKIRPNKDGNSVAVIYDVYTDPQTGNVNLGLDEAFKKEYILMASPASNYILNGKMTGLKNATVVITANEQSLNKLD